MGPKIYSLLCLAVLVCLPAIGRAQTIAPSLTEISGRVKPGDTVYVTESSHPVKGKLIEVSASSLALSVDGRRQDFNLAGVTRVERERRATKKGALIGLLAGAGGGIVGGAIFGAYPITAARQWDILVVFGGFGGGIGAATGAAIGAIMKHRETVFATSTPARLSLAPFVDRTHRGMVLSVRF